MRPATGGRSHDGAAKPGPEVDGAEVDGAEVDGPEVDGPEVDGPEVDGPEVDGPEVDVSGVDGGDELDAEVDAAAAAAPAIAGGRSRLATERALQQAAIRLLERDGVLAGLNLREVAAEAAVNRGLVYHYFGSRRHLLREALRHGARHRFGEVRQASAEPFRSRMVHFLHTMIRHRRAVRLATLLICDGDRELRTMPLRDDTLALLRRDVDQGELHEGVDLDAVHVAGVSLVYGYVLYRDAFATEMGISVDELDIRVAAAFDRMLGGVASESGSRRRSGVRRGGGRRRSADR